MVKKFSSSVTPILETKGHKTLLKELFVYYICKRRMGREGGGIQIECEGRSGRLDHDDHTMVDHLLDHLGSRALQSSCPQQCQPG